MGDLFDLRTVPEYNTRAVVNRTGVPADTFRAWERRYGFPHPARTESNRRLYSERDIAIISLLKQMTDDGVAISHAVAKTQRQITEEPSVPSADAQLSPPSRREIEKVRTHLLSAFKEFDTRRANRLVEDAMALMDIESLCVEIFQPVLIDIGDQWERGTVTVGVEHFASAFCMRRLSALLNASQPESGNPTVICSCVEGEHHEIGLMMTSVLLSRAGYRVIYLGGNLPGRELISTLRRIRPDAVVLSCSTGETCEAMVDVVDSLRQDVAGYALPIIGYGGAIFEHDPDRRQSIRAAYLGTNPRSVHARLGQLIASRARQGASPTT